MQLHCLLFCVFPAIVPYIEYIKIRVENFHLIIYANYKTYAKAMLCKFLSKYFAIVKDNCLPNYLESNINSILKSPNKLSIVS